MNCCTHTHTHLRDTWAWCSSLSEWFWAGCQHMHSVCVDGRPHLFRNLPSSSRFSPTYCLETQDCEQLCSESLCKQQLNPRPIHCSLQPTCCVTRWFNCTMMTTHLKCRTTSLTEILMHTTTAACCYNVNKLKLQKASMTYHVESWQWTSRRGLHQSPPIWTHCHQQV